MTAAIQKAYTEIHNILSELLDSALLDLSTEAKDCLEVFDQYEWEMKPECDEHAFLALQEKGISGVMTFDELNEFMNMVSRVGQYHLYLTIYEGRKAIANNAYY